MAHRKCFGVAVGTVRYGLGEKTRMLRETLALHPLYARAVVPGISQPRSICERGWLWLQC
jgi:hypothetical protein